MYHLRLFTNSLCNTYAEIQSFVCYIYLNENHCFYHKHQSIHDYTRYFEMEADQKNVLHFRNPYLKKAGETAQIKKSRIQNVDHF